MENEDNAEYLRYTGPQRVDRAMHTLEGILRGIAIDEKVNSSELSALTSWMGEHRQYADRHPFSEVLDRLDRVLFDGIIDEEEQADMLWLCGKFSTENQYFSQVSSDMQRMQGIMQGILSDGEISKEELLGLSEWMEAHSHLRTCWPYDELDALILDVLRDGVIDDAEHKALVAFFNDFANTTGHRAVELREDPEHQLISGVCVACPEVHFPDHTFCFTGKSERLTRDQLQEQVCTRGGGFSRTLTKKVNYLIVGADGNPTWAFACYGRKVEKAVQMRRKGSNLLIVHENDYWDAVWDA